MKKILYTIIISVISIDVFATVQCIGVPDKVYAGYHGPYPSEQSFGVILKGVSGRITLGKIDTDLAKARYSMVLSAQRAQAEVVIEFYHLSSPDDCSTAISTRALPTAMYSN